MESGWLMGLFARGSPLPLRIPRLRSGPPDGVLWEAHRASLVELKVGSRPTATGRTQREINSELGWLMGLEPTTTGITILDSTN